MRDTVSLIPTQHVEPREVVSVRLERCLHERLHQYATFIRSPKDYVIAQALERVFRNDKKFLTWLTGRSGERRAAEHPDEPGLSGQAPTERAEMPESGERVSRGRRRRESQAESASSSGAGQRILPSAGGPGGDQ
jgi:hypothetical protein